MAHLNQEKDIDKAIREIAADANLYGLDAKKVRSIWFQALLEEVAENDKKKMAH